MTPELKIHYTDSLASICMLEMINRQKPKTPKLNKTFEIMHVGDLEERFLREPFKEAINDPVWFSVRAGVKKIGYEIHAQGGTGLMRDVLEEAADKCGNQYGQAVSFIDHAWDGIGSWTP